MRAVRVWDSGLLGRRALVIAALAAAHGLVIYGLVLMGRLHVGPVVDAGPVEVVFFEEAAKRPDELESVLLPGGVGQWEWHAPRLELASLDPAAAASAR